MGIMWVVMLWSRVEFSRVASVAVTVTATPCNETACTRGERIHAFVQWSMWTTSSADRVWGRRAM
jgi:hypothetical protein